MTFGNPRNPSSSVLEGVTKKKAAFGREQWNYARKVNLLMILFSEDELAKGNPRRDDIELLDQSKISEIRGK